MLILAMKEQVEDAGCVFERGLEVVWAFAREFPGRGGKRAKIGNVKVKKVVSVYLNANVWNEEYYKNGKKFILEVVAGAGEGTV